MSDHSPRTAPPVTDVVHQGTPHATWCTHCKAWTGVAGTAVLLGTDGVTVLGTWSGCSICTEEDPRAC
ncbi:hypothetical protein ACFC00_40145 [Streptomyces adustus]|uniref:hypothetical protein n=1 Tax=Streptomyces adustus TaxID=1609272 RepID=UPI0035DE7B57